MNALNPDPNSLLNFPCEFPIKIIGLFDPDFEQLVIEIVRQHCQDLKDQAIRTRTSRGGKYVSITIEITAHNRLQLDNLYIQLSQHPKVFMVL